VNGFNASLPITHGHWLWLLGSEFVYGLSLIFTPGAFRRVFAKQIHLMSGLFDFLLLCMVPISTYCFFSQLLSLDKQLTEDAQYFLMYAAVFCILALALNFSVVIKLFLHVVKLVKNMGHAS